MNSMSFLGLSGFGLALMVSLFGWRNIAVPDWVFALLVALSAVLVGIGLFRALYASARAASNWTPLRKTLRLSYPQVATATAGEIHINRSHAQRAMYLLSTTQRRFEHWWGRLRYRP